MSKTRVTLCVVGAAVISIITGFLGGYLTRRQGIADGWDFNQWGNLGTWVAGVATLAAVGVALYQVWLARRDAELALITAQSRHDAELQRADDRLTRELDARKKTEQIHMIPPIWQEIMRLQMPFAEFKKVLEDVSVSIGNARTRDQRDKLAADLMPSLNAWLAQITELEAVFTLASIAITEPKVLQSVMTLYIDTQALREPSNAAAREVLMGNRPPNFEAVDTQMSKILTSRKPMVALARVHLADSETLQAWAAREGFDAEARTI